MEWLIDYGLAGLFIAAFLAATLLPLSSELMLGTLVLHGVAPVSVVAVATAGNVLGSLTCYGVGWWGSQAVWQRWLRLSDAEYLRARQRFARYGRAGLLLAWVPVIGDPLTVVAGGLRLSLWVFIPLVTLGKLGRYVVVVLAVS